MKAKIIGLVAALLAVATAGIVSLQTNALSGQVGTAPRCTVEAIGARSSAFSIANDEATVKFKVYGKKGCKVRLSTAAFYAPAMDGRPYNKQILYKRTTKEFIPGTYSMSIPVPTTSTPAQGCFYQLDLTYGIHNVRPVLAYAHGAIENCGTTPKTPHVKIEKTINDRTTENKTVKVGETYDYVLVVTNDGQVDLTNVAVRDTAPAGVEFISSNIPSASVTKTQFSYTIPELKVGYELTIKIQAKVTAESANPIKNTACVDAPAVPGNPDDCDDATVTTPVSRPAVSIVKTVNDTEHQTVKVNEPFTYEVVVTNTGDIALTNVAVRDNAPAGVTLTGASAGTVNGAVWNYTIPSLAVGESKTFTLSAVVKAYVAGTLKNTACVNAPEVNTGEPTKDDACDDATVDVTPPAANPAVSIVKTVNGQEHVTVGINQAFAYQVTVKNTGDVALTNVAVRDNTPAGVTLTGASAGTITGNVWNYSIPNLAVGQSMTFTLNGVVKAYVPGVLKNTACVNAPEVNTGEPTKDDACDDATVDVTPPALTPRIDVEKTVNGTDFVRVNINVQFSYQITVKNTGDVALTNVAVADTVQPGVTFVSASAGTVTASTWNHTIATLAVGQSASFTITATVPAYKAGQIKNTVCVNAPEVNPGSTAADDCDDATVEVVPPNMVEVCDPSTGTIITVPEDKKGNYLPKDDPKCESIKVCDLTTKQIVTIKKSDFVTGRHTTDLSRCQPAPVTTPTTPVVTELPRTGAEVVAKLVGAVSLAAGAAYYLVSRRNG